MKRNLLFTLSFIPVFLTVTEQILAQPTSSFSLKGKKSPVEPTLITFIELGSVNCIPCRMMQPVMKSIEQKYGSQINVVFYDVGTRGQSRFAQVYGIRVIPTQVFLDKKGKEILRHEGFFPEAEIDKLLQKHGLNAELKPR
jgi:thioredoxin 1